MICRFCHQNTISTLFEANKNSKKINIADYACTNDAFGKHEKLLKCFHCNVIYVDEKITQEQISTYYEVANDPEYFAQQEARRITFQRYLNRLPKNGKLLDVGTNTGLFVKIAKDNHWQAEGLEPNKWGVEFAKKNYGLNLINKPFEKETFKAETYDIITMWDVIEHFTDPFKQINYIYKFLKPNGVFAFSTVDPESILAKIMGTKWSWYMEMHKVFWSKKCAEYYLKKTGFKKVIFKPHFRYLSAGYLASRFRAVNPTISVIIVKFLEKLKLDKIIVPYYANDLYDCYAFK